MKRTPPTAEQVAKKITNFKSWLVQRGAELLKETNEYEMVRFKSGNTTAVIYRKKSDHSNVTFLNSIAEDAWFGFMTGSPWRANPATERRRMDKNGALYDTLRQRDGDECFFCAMDIPQYEGTIEHLVCLTHGGPEHISNKFLAHKECNMIAGTLSAVEKLVVYHNVRLKKALRQLNDNQGRRSDRAASDADSEASCEATG
jgi:hypothetical protein